MTYYQRFGLAREPFGTTPDPEMFYKTLGHEDCYERLKLAIHLQRGLSVIIGDIGYGKTTIKVALLQELQVRPAGGDPPLRSGSSTTRATAAPTSSSCARSSASSGSPPRAAPGST